MREKQASPMENFDHKHPETCKGDMTYEAEIRRRARKLSPDEVAEIEKQATPAVVDWSKYVIFIRHQGTTSTCIFQAVAACIDIIKERERRLTPNSSAWFLAYTYWNCKTGELDPLDSRMATPTSSQGDGAIKYGCCSEASYSSHVDIQALPNGKYRMPPLPDSAIQEASSYRIKEEIHETVPSIKYLKTLLTKGPLFAMNGGHARCLLGYDDNTSRFKFLNSYGDRHQGGYQYLSYNDMVGFISGAVFVRYINLATPESTYYLTGLVRLQHNISRNNLTVAVGVEGQAEYEIWPTPGMDFSGDDSEHLALTFPLPDYASAHWPPDQSAGWHLRVTDTSNAAAGTITGAVNEVTLAERPIGHPMIIHRPSSASIPIRARTSTKIYVPSRHHAEVTLCGPGEAHSGQQISLRGTLSTKIEIADNYSSHVAMPGKSIHVYRVHTDPIEGTIIDEEVGVATTDAAGNYEVHEVVSSAMTYQTFAFEPTGIMIVTSDVIEVLVTTEAHHKRELAKG